LGFCDRVNVSYVNTDGSNSLNNLSYTFPLNARNGRIELTYSFRNNEVIEKPFNILEIEEEKLTFLLCVCFKNLLTAQYKQLSKKNAPH
jgi:hemolysin activation/secretion protein